MGLQRTSRHRTAVTAVIANGTSDTGTIDLEGYVLAAIILPAAWTTAALTFRAVDELNVEHPVYDDAGTEVTVASTNVVANRAVVNKTILEQLAALGRIQIRSGTDATPVNQGAERILTLLLKS